jgi:multidrug efflux pump subunit AcrB
MKTQQNFEWQGKRQDQIETSNKSIVIAAICIVIVLLILGYK